MRPQRTTEEDELRHPPSPLERAKRLPNQFKRLKSRPQRRP